MLGVSLIPEITHKVSSSEHMELCVVLVIVFCYDGDAERQVQMLHALVFSLIEMLRQALQISFAAR
jgi:hypothetical protein